jgi:hypothetical protein
MVPHFVENSSCAHVAIVRLSTPRLVRDPLFRGRTRDRRRPDARQIRPDVAIAVPVRRLVACPSPWCTDLKGSIPEQMGTARV